MLSLQHIRKSFGAVAALKDVSLTVNEGEVHALIGENGAGKSTLMKILSGVFPPDSGKIRWQNIDFSPKSPADSRHAGICMVYQELALVPHLTIEENILLGIEKSQFGWIETQTIAIQKLLDQLGQTALRPEMCVSDLTIGQQQLVEIARALMLDAKLVVLDEPTSSLSTDEVQTLFDVIRQLKAKGVSVIYISHFLEEVQEIADRFTVLRDGETIIGGNVSETPTSAMIEAMIGRSVENLYPRLAHEHGDIILNAQNLSGKNGLPLNASFSLRRGEILGIAGLMGAGRSELLRTIFGLHESESGEIQVKGTTLKAVFLSPSKALTAHLNLLSEDRKTEGLALNLSLLHNITLSALKPFARWGFLNLTKEAETATHWQQFLRIKADSVHQSANTLSGGNQQKICLARLLHHETDILFLDEPTRGVDIGSKAEIYQLIQNLAAQGKAIVVVSSYLPELLGVCDSLAVMHKGTLSQPRPIHDWNAHDIMTMATAGKE